MFFTAGPALPGCSPDFRVIRLYIFADPADYGGVFDCIEVWRSKFVEGGPYEELTGLTWRGARLPLLGEDQPGIFVAGLSVNLVGKKLELVVNELDTIETTFTGSDPLTYAQAATQIVAQGLGRLRAWVDMGGKLVVETTEPGTAATLRAVSSDAAILLGLPTDGTIAYGKEARIQLAGADRYNFSDKAGSTRYFYKTRYRNRATNTVSEYSPVYQAQSARVDADNLVLGYLDLVDLMGMPLAGVEVSLRAPFIGALVEGKLVAGNDEMKKTDADGHVEFTLMRGQTYSLAIGGTNIMKEIVTPTDKRVTSFLLVDADFATQDDYFRARIPQIPTMARRSF